MTTLFDQKTLVPQGISEFLERSTVALSIADATHPDCPLVEVNGAFCDMTGYDEDEVIGKNCRFLQPFGGPGPVRARMRKFLSSDELTDGKFVIPNIRRDGTPFLNLLYMTKLQHGGITKLVLGSQFQIGRQDELDTDLYDRALSDDLRQLNLLTSEKNWVVLGSFDALASSHRIIARMRFE